jgi:hypothetical protein
MLFIYFSCPVALAGTSTTVLSRNGMNGHSCIVPDFREKAFNFLPVSMIISSFFPFFKSYCCKITPKNTPVFLWDEARSLTLFFFAFFSEVAYIWRKNKADPSMAEELMGLRKNVMHDKKWKDQGKKEVNYHGIKVKMIFKG